MKVHHWGGNILPILGTRTGDERTSEQHAPQVRALSATQPVTTRTTHVDTGDAARFSYGRHFDGQLEHYRSMSAVDRVALPDDERLNMRALELMAADEQLHRLAQRDGFTRAFSVALTQANASLLGALGEKSPAPKIVQLSDTEIDDQARAIVARDADLVAMHSRDGFSAAYRLALHRVGAQLRTAAV
ncbi:MAG TPA: hypothetical protein VGM50_13700 [Gemmatimonadaceae bacterium]|jgi:hypothetical protein